MSCIFFYPAAIEILGICKSTLYRSIWVYRSNRSKVNFVKASPIQVQTTLAKEKCIRLCVLIFLNIWSEIDDFSRIVRHNLSAQQKQQQQQRRNDVAHHFVSSAGQPSRNAHVLRLWKRQRVHGRRLQNLWRASETSQSEYTDHHVRYQPVVWFSRSGTLNQVALSWIEFELCANSHGFVHFFDHFFFRFVVGRHDVPYSYCCCCIFLQLADLSCLVYQKSTNTYAPYNKDWIKEKIYVLLRQAAGTEASGSSSSNH